MEQLHHYQEKLHTLGYNPKTIYSKIRNIKSFLTFTNKQEKQIQTKDLENYIKELKQRKLHSSTIYQYYTHPKEYFRYIKESKYISKNPFETLILHLEKQPYKERIILTQEEIQALYSKTKNLQEKILLHLAYGCGLRAIELERINTEELDIKNKLVIVEQGKNSKRRIIPINQTLQRDFTNYLKYRNSIQIEETALLLNQKQQRMKKHTALELLKKILKRTTLNKNITLHSLRHSIATHLLENGLSLENVKEFLGHKYLDTTEQYVRITKLEL
ncbi:hypothetical protein ETU10_00130 [Apibacter muscae]|uniref:tyrosine-type recombinase/integrase n=1 Tax=Apibacter muscae TaxID=2509004 RepID=UPI0011ADDE78|nr:tyrosine-type recombinase/integrase [Apibacter muscae]TWP25384.1 hypothetical protein ETU10_00130 [Apibacter muscae]